MAPPAPPVSAARSLPRLAPAAAVRSSAIRDLLALTAQPGILSLAGGMPALDAVHDDVLPSVAAEVLADAGAVQYGPTEGWPALRTWIAGVVDRAAGAAPPADPDDVLVTHGSQQALDLVVRALVEPGTAVVVERPTYLGAVQALTAARADAHAVAVDDDGIDTERLAAGLRAGLRPALCYLAPTFQNPSGVVMSAGRRAHLGALADRYGFVVVDDDPYRDLAFGPVPSRLRADVPDDLAVTLGTFSKVVAPGLRVGWAHGPRWLVGALTRLKQAADLHTSTVAQQVLAAAVARPGWWEARAARLAGLYRRRAGVLAAAVADHGRGRIEAAAARGGMFLWGRLTDGTDGAALLPAALRRGVAFVPGAEFSCDGAAGPHLRLCFATLDDAALVEAARRLGAALGDERTG